MFYHILYPLSTELSGLNIFQYITFRAAGAAITALIISFLVGPWIIRKLRSSQVLETIGERGPQSHQPKKGTPTMGGIIILAAVILPTLLWANLLNSYIHIILLATIWMGLFGFLDDYLKTVKKTKKGLVARYKLAGQIGLGIIIGTWIVYGGEFREIGPVTSAAEAEVEEGMSMRRRRQISSSRSCRRPRWARGGSACHMRPCSGSDFLYLR